MSAKTNEYAVMGKPIHHSLSPFLFDLFAKQTKQKLQYQTLEVEPASLQQALVGFKNSGGQGVNLTLPLKTMAYSLVHDASQRAQQAKAINVISFHENGHWYGDNVDGVGLIRDITEHHRYAFTDKRVLIIGAGGAVRGILPAIQKEHPRDITLVNRTVSHAAVLAKEYATRLATWSTLPQGYFDIVINGTSASLTHQTLPLPHGILHRHGGCYDLTYSHRRTPFLQWARDNQAAWYSDGRGMLIEQAAETFYLWHHKRVDTSLIRTFLNDHLHATHRDSIS